MYFASKYALTWLILLGVVAVVYMKAPRFISPPKKSYKVREGSKVKLKCEVTGANDPSHNRTLTAWRKLGIPVRNSIIRKSRYWDRFKVKNCKFLRIRNVKKLDAGYYLCIAKNQYGMVKTLIQLQVLPRPATAPANNISHHVVTVLHTQNPRPTVASKAPRFHVKQTIHAIKRTKGKLLRLPCHANGNPRPKIRWRKNNTILRRRRRVKTTSWTLVIRRLRVSDSGVYQCVIWNKHGNVTRTFFVQVIGKDLQDYPIETSYSPPDKPKPIIQKHLLKNATTLEGQTVTFSCTAFSREVPTFMWLKWTTFNHSNNITVKVKVLNSSTPNVRFVPGLTRRTGGKMYYSHQLKLFNVSMADQGQYTCVVGSTNGGIVSAHVYLTLHLKRQKGPKEEPRRKSTAQPANSLDGIHIPLAALIGVPAALVTLLIVAIIWCYIQLVKHRKQLRAKGATFMPVANGMAINGSYAAPTTIPMETIPMETIPMETIPMETLANGLVTHEPRPGMEMKQGLGVVLKVTHPPEVTHLQEVTQRMESARCAEDNGHTEYPVCLETYLQQNQTLREGASTNNESMPCRCHGDTDDITLNADNYTGDIRTPEKSSEVVCVEEELQDCSQTFSNDELREPQPGDLTRINSLSRDSVEHVDQYGVKNSDV